MSQYSFDEDSSYDMNLTDGILKAMSYRLPRKRMDLSNLNAQTLREVQQAAHVAHLMNARARRESRHFEHSLAVYEAFPQGSCLPGLHPRRLVVYTRDVSTTRDLPQGDTP